MEEKEERYASMQELIKMGINPFPAINWEVNTTAEEIIRYYRLSKIDFKDVSIAGRIRSKRIMGGASFGEIADHTGKIQFYIRKDEVTSPQHPDFYNSIFKKHIHTGDIVGIRGYVFTTRTGEITVGVKEMVLLTKCLLPMPVIKEKDQIRWTSFSDPEKRYRMRYLDLILNPEVTQRFIKINKIIQSIRTKLLEKGYIEVETPILQPIYGGANARPFITHLNAIDTDFYLRIANELYLKRLIVGGLPGVFEFSRNFRNEGIDRTHHPEFTMLEIYVPYRDYYWMMDFTEELLSFTVQQTCESNKITYQDKEIDFSPPWQRISYAEAIKKFTGIDIFSASDEELREFLRNKSAIATDKLQRHQLLDELFSHFSQPNFINPTIVYDYPVELSPLACRHRNNPRLTERFELIVCGMEIANAFTELNDPIDQYERFKMQREFRNKGDLEAMPLDLDYIRALSYGLPPTAGIGIGINRLAMLLTNAYSIQEVILFPLMSPEKIKEEDILPQLYLHQKETQTTG